MSCFSSSQTGVHEEVLLREKGIIYVSYSVLDFSNFHNQDVSCAPERTRENSCYCTVHINVRSKLRIHYLVVTVGNPDG